MNKKKATKIIFLIITLSFFQNYLLISEFYNNNENYTDSTLENPFSRTDVQVKNHIEISKNAIASIDVTYFTVTIINPKDEEIVNGTVNITVECKSDNLGLDEVQIFINGELKSTTKMPDYLPYPEVTYELNTTEYENGDMNITAKAVDITGNSKNDSINVFINNTDSFWDFLPDDPKTLAIIAGTGLVGLFVIGATLKRIKKRRVARTSLKGVFRDNISKRRKGHTKKTRAKPSRAETGYWKKTRSKPSRTETGYWKKTGAKTSRAGLHKVSTKKKLFSKLRRR